MARGPARQESSPAAALAKLRQATLTLGTSHLARSGVANVRILNESAFLDIVKGMVGCGEAPWMECARSEPAGEIPAERGPKAERRRRPLRGKHEESLRVIEVRIGRFSRAFQDLSLALEKLEGDRGCTRRGLDLLRQMLLGGSV